MAALYLPLQIEQGATFRQPLRWRNADQTYRDFTGCSALMHIRLGVDNDDIYLALSTANGRIILDDEGWIIMVIPAEITRSLIHADGLVYDLEVTDTAASVDRLLEGPVYVRKEVTR